MPPAPLVDPATIDMSTIVADREGIRRANLQRFEMEQLDAVLKIDPGNRLIIGFKDVREDEFWVRGHMPDFPLFPGVLMCETAAQLCSFYAQDMHLIDEGFLGFGGMEEVRFRGPVRPGDRLIMVAKATRVNRRQTIFETQGFVGGNMVYHGRIIGVPLQARNSETAQENP